MSYSFDEIKNIAQEKAKVAKITVPSKGYDSGIAEVNSNGFIKWLKHAADWGQITETKLKEFIGLFNEAHRKILMAGNEIRAKVFYSELSALSSLGIETALWDIKLELVKILSAFIYEVSFCYVFVYR